MILKRARIVHCSEAERDAIRERAAAAGKTLSRFLLDPVAPGDREDGVAALTPAELVDLCEGLRALVAFLRAPGGGQGLAAARGGGVVRDVAADGLPQGRRVRVSVSATDEEWALVRERAAGRGLSISDFLVGLALPAGSASGAGPLPALNGLEQREALDALRQMRKLLSAGDGRNDAPSDVRERHAGSPDAPAAGSAGPEQAGREALPGDGRAEGTEAVKEAGGGGGISKTARQSGRGPGADAEPRQGRLI